MTCQSTQELILQDIFAIVGNQMLITEVDMPQSLRSSLVGRQQRATEASRERSAEQVFDDLKSKILLR